MRQILKFGQIRQLQIQRVNHQPAIGANNQQQSPYDDHHPIVEENQIVENRKEEERQQADNGENGKRP